MLDLIRYNFRVRVERERNAETCWIFKSQVPNFKVQGSSKAQDWSFVAVDQLVNHLEKPTPADLFKEAFVWIER